MDKLCLQRYGSSRGRGWLGAGTGLQFSGQPAAEGELVITNLGRVGMPIIRYRTGDRVKLHEGSCDCGRTFDRLEGGVIGRVDDVIIIRGVNVFPSQIESLLLDVEGIEPQYVIVVKKKGWFFGRG